MKDIKPRLEKLIADAAECDLIGTLAADPEKREAFRRLAQQYRTMADELQAVAKNRTM